MNPDYRVRILNYKGEPVEVRYVTLVTWKAMLAFEAARNPARKVCATIVRKHLSCPRKYPVTDLHAHIVQSLEDINQQLGVAE